MRGGEFLKWIHSGQISDICFSGESWCDREAVLEDTCPAECEAFSFCLFGTYGCTKVERKADMSMELRNNTLVLNNFCHKVNCVEGSALASCSVPVWSTWGTES